MQKEWNSRKSRDTWNNRQIWPWSTKWSRSKANRVLPRECTGHSKHPLPKTYLKKPFATGKFPEVIYGGKKAGGETLHGHKTRCWASLTVKREMTIKTRMGNKNPTIHNGHPRMSTHSKCGRESGVDWTPWHGGWEWPLATTPRKESLHRPEGELSLESEIPVPGPASQENRHSKLQVQGSLQHCLQCARHSPKKMFTDSIKCQENVVPIHNAY